MRASYFLTRDSVSQLFSREIAVNGIALRSKTVLGFPMMVSVAHKATGEKGMW
jgi:hypothetical protein